MISGNQLDEAINKAMKKILKENNYSLSGEEKYPQYNQDADRWWKLEFESNPEAAAKKAHTSLYINDCAILFKRKTPLHVAKE